jgi:hypothetical protein
MLLGNEAKNRLGGFNATAIQLSVGDRGSLDECIGCVPASLGCG